MRMILVFLACLLASCAAALTAEIDTTGLTAEQKLELAAQAERMKNSANVDQAVGGDGPDDWPGHCFHGQRSRRRRERVRHHASGQADYRPDRLEDSREGLVALHEKSSPRIPLPSGRGGIGAARLPQLPKIIPVFPQGPALFPYNV